MITEYIKNIFSPILHDFIKIYIFWTFVHYVSVEAYKYWCSPKTLIDFIISPINIQSPLCKSINWCFTVSVNSMTHIFTIGTTWVVGIATGVFKGRV